MKSIETSLNGVVLMEPSIHTDERGYFYESYNHRDFESLTGLASQFRQENHSVSNKGVLRGIHYQLPKPQGKLIRCVDGEIWDVAVDLRRSSPTYKQWRGYRLTSENRHQLWIPVGFGHGFCVLSGTAQVLYKTTELWDSRFDRSIRWDDPDLAVDWPMEGAPLVSLKDAEAPYLDTAPLFD